MKVISHILLLFDIKHMLFFQKGQLSNLDKLGKIAKVNTRRGLVMFLSLHFFASLSFADIILFGKSLTWIFCDGNSETKTTPPGPSEGRAAFYCFTAPTSTS